MSAVAAPLKGKTAPKAHSSSMETMIINVDQVNSWKAPPFQRPVRVNPKVEAMAEKIKADGASISGVITLGRLTKDPVHYIVDGQHRLEAFKISGMPEIIADLRIMHFDTMAEMADEFVHLNTALVRMRPDDILRGVAPTMPNVARIMEECPYIGYSNVRRGGGGAGPIVSLGSVLRCWAASITETPDSSSRGHGIAAIAGMVDEDSSRKLIGFMHLAHDAWGRDPEYYRLWANCNLGLTMWLYRRVVLDTSRKGSQRVSVLTQGQYKQCLMALSAKQDYLDWLAGRLLNDRDRSPALMRIKTIFARRMTEAGVTKITLPQPAWASR